MSGDTKSALNILKNIIIANNVSTEESLDELVSWYGYENTAIGILENIGCKIFNDRNNGMLKIGEESDTSDSSISIDLHNKTFDIYNIFNESIYIGTHDITVIELESIKWKYISELCCNILRLDEDSIIEVIMIKHIYSKFYRRYKQ